MSTSVSFVVSQRPGFKIRTKADAKTFLLELLLYADGSTIIPDVKDSKKCYVLHKTGNDPKTMGHIAHERRDIPWYEAVVLRSDAEAIDMAFAARKSLNARFFGPSDE